MYFYLLPCKLSTCSHNTYKSVLYYVIFKLLNGVRNKSTVSKNIDLLIQFNSGVPNEKLQEK